MKKVILSLIFLATVSTINAQSMTNFSYSIGFPSGDFSSYISEPSFRGFAFGYSKFVKPNISIGGNLGWQVFYESKDYNTYHDGTASLSGKQFRTNGSLPVTANANYYFKQSEKTNIYGGLGLGMVYNHRNTDMYVYTIDEESFNFTLQPEIGVEFRMNYNMFLTAAGKYYYCFEAGDIPEPISFFTLNIGIAYRGK